MGNIHGCIETLTKKASEDFTQALYPGTFDSTGTIVSMADSASDNNNIRTIVQNKPKAGQGAHCPKKGEIVEFVCGETLVNGDSCGLSAESGEWMKLKKITLDGSGTTYKKRIIEVITGGDEDEIGTGYLTLDWVLV